MEPSTFLFIFIGIINLVLAIGFIYYAFKNTFRLKGAVTQYLILTSALFFVITGVISVIGLLIFDIIFIVRYIVFIVGFILISMGEIYLGRLIRKVGGKKPWLTIARTFSYSGYRSSGILVILLFSIPIWTLGIITRPASIYGMTASLFTMLGFILLITGERKLYVATNVFSDAVTIVDRKEVSLLRDDMAAVRVYADIINTFLSFGKPAMSAMIIDDTLNKWSEEHPVLFENSPVGNGKIDTGVVVQNLDRVYEKNRLSAVLKEFSVLTIHLVDLYGGFTSSEYAKERLTESYKVIRKKYGDISIIFDILRTMPEGILEDEKLALLSRDELEEKIKERTLELINANKELQIEIKERKQTERELKKSKQRIELKNIQLKKLDELRSNFLNITSHELRTPMASIKGYIQMLLKQILGDINEEQKRGLEVVLRNTDRLDALIQDILDISRLESGTLKFFPEKTDIGKIVTESVETMQSAADLKNIRINADVKDRIPELVVDQERVKQVLVNLIDNAIKFSPDSSSVNVRAKRQGDDVLFEVQDFGRGIPKDEQKRVFEAFYQVDSGMDRKFGGAGLGLSVSRGIILAHGGEIRVRSTLNKGSTFVFTLPIEPVQDIEGRFKEADIFRV